MKIAAIKRKPRTPKRSTPYRAEDPEILDDPYIPPSLKSPIEPKCEETI